MEGWEGGFKESLFTDYKIGFRRGEAEIITGQPSGHRVNGGLEDSVGTVGIVRFEFDSKVIDEKDRLDGVRNHDEDIVHCDEEKRAAQRGALRDPIGLVVGRRVVIGNSNLKRAVSYFSTFNQFEFLSLRNQTNVNNKIDFLLQFSAIHN